MTSKKLSHIFNVIIIVLLIGIIVVLIIKYERDSDKDQVKNFEEFIFSTKDVENIVKEVKDGYEITLNNY